MASYKLTKMLGALAALAATSLPLSHALGYKTTHLEATFNERLDDDAVGMYQTLHWNNMNVSHGMLNHSGLIAGTTSTGAPRPLSAYTCHDSLTVSLFGPASISTNYLFSQVAMFDLASLNWGCLTLDPLTHKQASMTPQNCSMTMKGYPPARTFDLNGNPAQVPVGSKPQVEATWWYNVPEDAREFEMAKIETLDRWWWALGTVTFEASGFTGPALVCFDDFKIKAYNVTYWGQSGIGRLVHEKGNGVY